MQSSLFDDLRRVDSPRFGYAHRNADANELAAAKKQVFVGAKTRRVVLQAIADSPIGLSRPQIAKQTGIKLQSVCGRVKELLDNGWAEKTKRRVNGSGVVVATTSGRKQLRIRAASPGEAGSGLPSSPASPVSSGGAR